MTSYRIRPRFKQLTPLKITEVKTKMQTYFDQSVECEGTVTSKLIVFKIPLADQHFWSPQLSVSLEEHEENGTILRGLYGPNPMIWTMFTFAYGSIGVSGIFALLLGMTRWSLGLGTSFLWVFFGLMILAGILYLVAQFGQKLGVEQTFTLHHAFESIIYEKVHIE